MSARRHPRAQRAQAGITLIEAMIALTIMGIVATMVWTAFSQTSRSKARVEEDLDRMHVIQMALERMARELSMAYVSTHRPASPALLTVHTAFIGHDHGGRDRVDFTSFSHQRLYRNAHESDQNELSYFVTRDPEDGRRQVLARREQNRIDDDPTRGGQVEIMVNDVTSFELEYLDPTSKQWVRSWDTTQGTGQVNRLPSQVRITLEVPHHRDRNRTLTYGTRASLPMVWALNHASYNP
ncbi:MAG: prepilin-type N-terminal cleavage/methylation domain-containing protein [Myxococcales bacterium]|nr:prepilin-type N-terminal cleavage/methylation domain-containing protein [Myxococcales bacterium]MCB9628034.1 prepilin-type N-terminal cleavage/methylation domain-containing protein [Sandaracinaceae bacterium]